jgi:glycosyltransferase involved in cell wall biosynthesis
MRIGFDITPVTATRTGVGNYCYFLLKHLIATAPDCTFLGFSSGSARVALGPLKSSVAHRRIALPTRVLYAIWNTFGAPAVDTFLGGVDVYHATNYFVPPTRTARRVVTIHDLTFVSAPELCSPKIRGVFSKQIRRFAREADAVIACSESTKSDIVRLLEIAPEKVTVVYEAVDEEIAPMDPGDAARRIEEEYGIRGPFVLFVSTLEPRKNVPVLLRAFARAARDLPHKLVLVGGVGWNAGPIFATIRELNLSDRVVHTGFVSSLGALSALYSGAAAFVFPTLYEGFGLSILEAMTCGCPVIASNSSSVPEVAGDAALLRDANDVEGIAAALRSVIDDARLRESLIARGHEQARKFSWDRCAKTTLEIYRRLVS